MSSSSPGQRFVGRTVSRMMSSTIRHLGEVLAYAATRRRHHQHDASVAEDLVASPEDLDLPEGLTLTWLGVAGVSIEYAGTRVVIDPYVTRLPLADLLRRRVVAPDREAIDLHVPHADAILLGHTHFDHALDASEIARRDGGKVYGGASAVRLMALHGLREQAVEVEPHRIYEIGPFEVTFVPSVHSSSSWGCPCPTVARSRASTSATSHLRRTAAVRCGASTSPLRAGPSTTRVPRTCSMMRSGTVTWTTSCVGSPVDR